MAATKVQIFDKKTLEQFKAFDSAPENNAVEGIFNPIRRLIKFAISVAVERAKEEAQKQMKEFDEEKARATLEAFVDQIGDGQIWQWLITGGFKKLLEIFLQLLPIFV